MNVRVLLLAENLGLALAYFLGGRFGLSLAFVHSSVTAVWPPTGIALTALLWRGPRLWPGVFLGAFLVNLAASGTVGSSIGIATGNTLEAVCGAWLVCRYAGGMKAFERTATLFQFMLLAAVLSTLPSASIGVTSLLAGGQARWDRLGSIWLTWWLGDMTSNITLAPLLVVWLAQPFVRLGPKAALEAVLLLFAVAAVGALVFLEGTPFDFQYWPLEYLAIPPLLWAALRFGERGALTYSCVISGLAIWGTLHGQGPFARADRNQSLLLLQAFMGATTLTALAIASTILERKRTESELHEAREALRRHAEDLEKRVEERTTKLRETIKSLDGLCYAIAHDLRAPLRAVGGYSQALESDCSAGLDNNGREYLERMRTAVARMDQLILDLLRLGRLESAELPAETVRVDETVSKVTQVLSEEISTGGAVVRLKEPFPALRANPRMLEQVLVNLVSNALKFVPAGKVPEVEISAETRAEMVRVWVQDNGVGIKPEHVGKLFQPFVRLVRGPEFAGTGMGLAIVRKAVERMGGEVGVESVEGKGSRFWIELPQA
jgi:signal transduction histidine kinase